VISDWELWACAQHYVSRHGEDAGVMAGMRCDELLRAGDFAGVHTYHAIIERINELLEARSGPIH
jgi:hypothetical protein